jgi:hypothetical protein
MDDLPILCTLTEAELKERRETLLKEMREAALTVMPLPLGYSCTFNRTTDVLMRLARVVDMERQCCPFLTFKIVVEPGQAPLRLEVTGPPDAKPLLADFFGGDM